MSMQSPHLEELEDPNSLTYKNLVPQPAAAYSFLCQTAETPVRMRCGHDCFNALAVSLPEHREHGFP